MAACRGAGVGVTALGAEGSDAEGDGAGLLVEKEPF